MRRPLRRAWIRALDVFIYWRQRWREWRCAIRWAEIQEGRRPVSRHFLGQSYDLADEAFDRYDEACLCTSMDRDRATDYTYKALTFTLMEPMRRKLAGRLDAHPEVGSPAIVCEFSCESAWHTYIVDRAAMGAPADFDPNDPGVMAEGIRFAYYRAEPPRPGMIPILMSWPDPDHGEVRVFDHVDDPRIVAGFPPTYDIDGRAVG